MISSEKKLIKELNDSDFLYKDINDIFEQKKLPARAVEIVLKWIPLVYEEHLGTGDQLVRSLISADEPFDPTILIDIFENSEYNFSIKSGIAYTLAFAKTFDISVWVKNQLTDKNILLSRYGLIAGLPNKGKFGTVIELKKFLKQIFDKYPTDEALKLWKKYGTLDDIPFLLEKSKKSNKKLSKNIEKVITDISKRNV